MTVNGSSLSRFPSKDENVTESGPPAIESMLHENHSTIHLDIPFMEHIYKVARIFSIEMDLNVFVQLNKYETTPYCFLLNQNLTCDCLLISVLLPEFT